MFGSRHTTDQLDVNLLLDKISDMLISIEHKKTIREFKSAFNSTRKLTRNSEFCKKLIKLLKMIYMPKTNQNRGNPYNTTSIQYKSPHNSLYGDGRNFVDNYGTPSPSEGYGSLPPGYGVPVPPSDGVAEDGGYIYVGTPSVTSSKKGGSIQKHTLTRIKSRRAIATGGKKTKKRRH
jgi:hypothetical protein